MYLLVSRLFLNHTCLGEGMRSLSALDFALFLLHTGFLKLNIHTEYEQLFSFDKSDFGTVKLHYPIPLGMVIGQNEGIFWFIKKPCALFLCKG